MLENDQFPSHDRGGGNPAGTNNNDKYQYILNIIAPGETDHSPTPRAGGHKVTVSIPTPYMSPEEMGKLVHNAINNSGVHNIQFNSLPQNGQYIEISNDITNFVIIFHDVADARPNNPVPGRVPYYVDFEQSFTTTQLLNNTSDTIQRMVAGIPNAFQLGLPPLLYPRLQYFIHL